MTYITRHKMPIITAKKIIELELEEGETIDDPILEALLENNVQDLSSHLNNLEAQVEEEHISCALDINSSLLEILLSHHTARVTQYIICEAIENKQLGALKILLNHHTAKVEGSRIYQAIKDQQLDILEILLDHHTAEVESMLIYQTIQNKQLDALQILLNHPTAKVTDWMIIDSIKNQELFNLLNDKLTSNSDTEEAQEIETLFVEDSLQESPLIGEDSAN